MVKILQSQFAKLKHFWVVVKQLVGPQYRNLFEKLELLGHVRDVKNKTRARRSRTTENIADADAIER